MATGFGKTFTACAEVYWLTKYAKTRRRSSTQIAYVLPACGNPTSDERSQTICAHFSINYPRSLESIALFLPQSFLVSARVFHFHDRVAAIIKQYVHRDILRI